jgi:hypothetical protein
MSVLRSSSSFSNLSKSDSRRRIFRMSRAFGAGACLRLPPNSRLRALRSSFRGRNPVGFRPSLKDRRID